MAEGGPVKYALHFTGERGRRAGHASGDMLHASSGFAWVWDSLMVRSWDWKSVGQGLALFGMRACQVLREGDRCAAPPTAEGVHEDRGEGLPDWEFLGSSCASGIESRDDRTQEVDAVCGVFDGSTKVLFAVDWVADEGPADGVEPEEGDEDQGKRKSATGILDVRKPRRPCDSQAG
jgi:hypothetical protein